MKFKGTYSAGTTYNVGDVVIYAQDNNVYHLQKPAKAGTAPHDTLYWGQVDQPLDEAVRLMADVLGLALEADETTEAAVRDLDSMIGSLNLTDYGLVLNSITEGSTKRFDITVDDSGEITATEIEEGEE